MKKFFLITFGLLVAIGAVAQDDIDISSLEDDGQMEQQSGWNTNAVKHNNVITNSFFSNWFVSLSATASAFYSDNEPEALSGSPLKEFRNNLGLSFAIGKWFTPGLGLRTKMNGFWGRNVISDKASDNSINYLALQEQALFNLSNMVYGYNPSRKYNFVPYIGFGFSRNLSHNENSLSYSLGLLNSLALSEKLSLSLDINYSRAQKTASRLVPFSTLNMEIGLSYNIGGGKWKKAPDAEALHEMYQMEIEAINAQLEDERMENENLRQQLESKGENVDK
ncbi:MAG: hypothetical protein MR802_03205 [Prevotella sp.]|nr:hypothetical protein [Prevotella sp.]